jgi:hypothetical protein
MPYQQHLESYESLITPYQETRAGFIALALEKNRKATPFVEEAKALKVIAQSAKTPKELLNIKNIKSSLLTASGISNKAMNHLREEDKNEAILGLIENFLEPSGKDFVDELVYRFLLTISFSVKHCQPFTFFVGAAIEKSMAQEIYQQLENKILTNAANLTCENQVVSLCSWLIAL